MKIIALQAENIKKIVAIEIHPDSNFVEITGANGQGKTSALDCIWWALEGAKHIQAIPIRKGAKEARIRLDLGELIVSRTFKLEDEGEITTKLVVTNAEGTNLKRPQDVLDKLIGALSFDPLEFTRKDSKTQFNILAKFVTDVDFEAIAVANKIDYDARTLINKRAKDAATAASQIVLDANFDSNQQPIDETELVNQLAAAGKSNSDIEVRRANRKNVNNRIKEIGEEIFKLTKEAAELQEKLDKAGELPQSIDVSDLQKRIADAKAINAQISMREEKEEYGSAAKELESESRNITQNMAKRDAEKQRKIAAANLPVEGITFGDGVLLLNSVPFEQASYAEQLRASISIAMAWNPNIRVIRVDEASSLDSKSLSMVKDMAIKNNFQIWLSRTDDTGKVGVVLESGFIKSKELEQVEDF